MPGFDQVPIVSDRFQPIENLLQQFVRLTYHESQRLDRTSLVFEPCVHFTLDLSKNAVQCLRKVLARYGIFQPGMELLGLIA
jgi:hypothetical protein